MTRVKICGIQNEFDRDCAVYAGADAVGFVVEIPRSCRCIDRERARSLIEGLPPFVTSVIVTSPKSVKEASDLACHTKADVIQVHETLSLENLEELRLIISQKIVSAMAVPLKSENEAFLLAKVADALLLDTFKDGKLGGSGQIHDWDVSADLVQKLQVPVILAGGLNPHNVAQAVEKVRPYAVDVASGVETNGKKDCQKIDDFVRVVKSCFPR